MIKVRKTKNKNEIKIGNSIIITVERKKRKPMYHVPGVKDIGYIEITIRRENNSNNRFILSTLDDSFRLIDRRERELILSPGMIDIVISRILGEEEKVEEDSRFSNHLSYIRCSSDDSSTQRYFNSSNNTTDMGRRRISRLRGRSDSDD